MRHQFAIFQMYFSPSSERQAFMKETDGRSVLEHAQEHFGSYFEGKQLTLYKTKGSGEVMTYPNDILRKEGDVILLRVNNVQHKTLVKRRERQGGVAPAYEEVTEESNPYSYVIIDNRPGVSLMAIQLSSAWGSRTELVRDLLQHCLGKALRADYGLDLMINAKIHTVKFWDYVYHQIYGNHDQVKKIVIDVLNSQRVVPKPQPDAELVKGGTAEMMRHLSRLVDGLQLSKASIEMMPDWPDRCRLNEGYKDWVQIVNLCASRAYTLSVHFERMGVYRCDQQVTAVYPLEKKAVQHFWEGSKCMKESTPEGEYALVSWLDFVRKEIKDFNDAKQTPKKPKGKRRQ